MGELLSARLLGEFSIQVGHRACSRWERPAARRMIQLLLLRPSHRMGREELAEVFFPKLTPPRAANAVSKALTMARRVLESGVHTVLEADRNSIWLNPDLELEIDLQQEADQLRAALALPPDARQAGALSTLLAQARPLLPDEMFAEWAAIPREMLEELRERARLALARDTEGADPIGAWAGVMRQNPTDELACAALMRAYAEIGRRDQAIRTFHRCRAALKQELDVEPSEELIALHAGITATAASRSARPEWRRAPTVSSLGRERLVAEIVSELQRPQGAPAVVLVTGPAGIGKTNLLSAVASRLEPDGWRVLWAVADPDDRMAPYSSLRATIRPLLEEMPTELRLLRDVVTGEPRPAGSAEQVPARLAAEVVAMLDAAALYSPILLVLDDVHWMDRSQQALLNRISARASSQGWRILLGARSDEPKAMVPLLASTAPRYQLGLLPSAAMARVIGDLPGAEFDRRTTAQIVRRSGGNPFFGLELARLIAGGGAGEPVDAERSVPDRIVELLRGRLAHGSPAARALAPLVALAGEDASYELILNVGSQHSVCGSIDRCIRALDELVALHLLVETSEGLRVVHPLLRDAALTTINAVRRSHLHAALADGLEVLDDPGSTANHRIAAYRSARLPEFAMLAATAALAASRRARAIFANDAARELVQAGLSAFGALRGEDRQGLLSAAAEAWVTLGEINLDEEDLPAAGSALRAALAIADSDDDRARAWSAMGGVAYHQGALEAAAEVYREGLTSLGSESAHARAALLSDLGWVRHRQGRGQEALAALEEARPVLTAGDTSLGSRCLDRLAVILLGTGRSGDALKVSDEALAMAQRIGDASMEAVVRVHRASVSSELGAHRAAIADLDDAASTFHRSQDRYMQSVTLWVRAEVLEQTGDREGALAARRAETAILEELGNQRNLAGSLAHQAQLLARLGRQRRARQLARAALESARAAGDQGWLDTLESELVAAGLSAGKT